MAVTSFVYWYVRQHFSFTIVSAWISTCPSPCHNNEWHCRRWRLHQSASPGDDFFNQSFWQLVMDRDFFFFCSNHMACRILVPPPGFEALPLAVEVQNLNHWTTREVWRLIFWYSLGLVLPILARLTDIFLWLSFSSDWQSPESSQCSSCPLGGYLMRSICWR